MRRKRAPKSRDMFGQSYDHDELDLANAPESDLADFGDTATRGFSEAWDDSRGPHAHESDAAVAGFSSDPEDTKGRNLDKKSKKGIVLLALLVLIGGGLGYTFQTGVFDKAGQDASVIEDDISPLLAPGDIRIYEAEPTSIDLNVSAASTNRFVETNGGGPVPVTQVDDPARSEPDDSGEPQATSGEEIGDLPQSIGAGPVLWAGRLHVAVFAEDVGEGATKGDQCVVVSLVTDSFIPIDVAAHGKCDAAFAATGDRVACAGDDLVLMEVWSDDPTGSRESRRVPIIRYRIEDNQPLLTDAEMRGSLRGNLDLPVGGDLLAAAAELGGGPGDLVTISGNDGALSATCTLLDRSEVAVKLLPS